MQTVELSQIEKALFFPALLDTEVREAATMEAIRFIKETVGETGQDVRQHMQQYFQHLPYGGWGEATAICTQQVIVNTFVIDKMKTLLDLRFFEDQKMFTDSLALGVNVDNPWVLDLNGDGVTEPERVEALNLRIYVIAESSQGDEFAYGNSDGVWTIEDVPVTTVGYLSSVLDERVDEL